MICRKPYTLGYALPVGCGQCIPCRINRRRVWASRQVLESRCHDANTFLTLTYDEENMPEDGSLDPLHLRYFFDRLRKRLGYSSFRYLAVGEYGDQTWRPHYHVNLFGIGPELAEVYQETWARGFTYAGDFNWNTATYVSGYVVKKMTKPDDWRLDGRYPEFARMSRDPGLGAPAIDVLLQSTNEYRGWDGLVMGSSPGSVKASGKTLSLGRYLSNRFRDRAGFTPEYLEQLKQEWINAKTAELLPLHETVLSGKALSVVSASVQAQEGKIQSLEWRHHQIQRGTL